MLHHLPYENIFTTLYFPLMNALFDVYSRPGHLLGGKIELVRNEKNLKWVFLFKNPYFALCLKISSSINLFFLKSG